MIRLLPFILVPVLILAGLGYWRYSTQQTVSPQATEKVTVSQAPVEVPKTLPGASLEDRVKSLEDTIIKLVPQVNNLKPSSSPAAASTSLDTRLANAESTVTELKARVSTLEKVTPAPVATSGKSTVYIPLGSGGSWSDVDWHSLSEYEISLNPDNYPGYTGMILEVAFRLAESAGTGSIRLYNITDASATSSELSITGTSFSLQSSSSFNIPSGTKTYRLQVKSTQRKDLFIQTARIKVNF